MFGSKLSIAWARFRGVARNAWRQYKSSFSRGRAPLSTPWINNGFAKYRTRDLDGAINDFSVAIRLDPLSANAYAHRGNAFAKKGEIDDALRDFNAAIRIDPRFAVAYANRGAIWIRKHEYDKANDDFAEAIRMNPKVAIAYLGRGISSTVREDFDSVVADCMEAISLDPVCSDAYATRANAWINKNEFDKAISDFTQVLRLVPQSVVAYTGRGCARAKKGEFETAINDLTEAIRIDPRFVEAHNNLGWIYASAADARFRDGAKALEHAQLACDLSGYKSGLQFATSLPLTPNWATSPTRSNCKKRPTPSRQRNPTSWRASAASRFTKSDSPIVPPIPRVDHAANCSSELKEAGPRIAESNDRRSRCRPLGATSLSAAATSISATPILGRREIPPIGRRWNRSLRPNCAAVARRRNSARSD